MGRHRLLAALVLLILATAAPSPFAQETIDPAGDGSQYGWAENIGWINAEPGGDGGSGVRLTVPDVGGWLWSENVGWISLACDNTGSCATVDYGVALDGSGALTGWAWAENIGWVSFSCHNTLSCGTVDYGVTVNTDTGELSGFAWAENVGWLGFSCANTASCGAIDYGVRTETPVAGSEIFTDGFESGDISEWSASVP